MVELVRFCLCVWVVFADFCFFAPAVSFLGITGVIAVSILEALLSTTMAPLSTVFSSFFFFSSLSSAFAFPTFSALSSSPESLLLTCSTISFILSGMVACTFVHSRALLSHPFHSSFIIFPASSFNELVGLGSTSKHRITMHTSFSVNFSLHSLFKVSTQTSPVRSQIFGWKILVRKVALGGFVG